MKVVTETKKFKISDGILMAQALSSNGDKVYAVRKIDNGMWTCSCMAYRFTKGPVGKKSPCKHIKKVWERKNIEARELISWLDVNTEVADEWDIQMEVA